jgi:hypothetical protein
MSKLLLSVHVLTIYRRSPTFCHRQFSATARFLRHCQTSAIARLLPSPDFCHRQTSAIVSHRQVSTSKLLMSAHVLTGEDDGGIYRRYKGVSSFK